MIQRRHFLKKLGLLTPAAFLRAQAEGSVKTISLIHTTDLHGHILPTRSYAGLGPLGGLARCATVIRRWRQESPHSLLIDAGDLYQGTEVSDHTRGQLMVKLLNHLRYDAWVLGNHDFDWGSEPLQQAAATFAAPILASNLTLAGKKSGTHEKSSPFARVAPWVMKEVAGFKIALIGLTTPGLDKWLPPEIRRDVTAHDPTPAVKTAVAEAKQAGAHALISIGHMGFKHPHNRNDDFANRVGDVTRANPELNLFIGAHTHQDIPSHSSHRTPYTQANYHGLHLGRVDLTFHVETARLIETHASTTLMDDRYLLDPEILALAQHDLDLSQSRLEQPVATLAEPLSPTTDGAAPSEQQRLIAAAIARRLRTDHQTTPHAILHGLFSDDLLTAGSKKLSDLWKLIPYENFVVTGLFTKATLIPIVQEALNQATSDRRLIGLTTIAQKKGKTWTVTDFLHPDGTALDPAQPLLIAFNSYDAQSGGGRLSLLHDHLSAQPSQRTFYSFSVRDSLLRYLAEHPDLRKNQLTL